MGIVRELKLTPDAQDEIVERLEKLLACAKAGDISGLVLVYEYREGGTDGSWDLGKGCRPTSLLGELTRMSVRMAMRISNEPTDDDE